MAKNTIKLKSYNNVHYESNAAEAVTPGHLVELDSSGDFQKHSTADGPVVPIFALEDAYHGNGIAVDYATDDRLFGWIPGRGDEVYAHISVIDVSPGDLLVSAGDGTLRKHDVASSGGVIQDSDIIVGVALESITAGNQGKVLIK